MENKYDGITFARILEQEKLKTRSFCTVVSEQLDSLYGIKCSERQIRKYKSGDVVPSANVAKAILQICEIEMSDTEILNLIEFSKENKFKMSSKMFNYDELTENYADSLHKRLTLRNSDFDFLQDSEVDSSMALELILSKINDEFGDDKNAFNRYIVHLINKDMKE